jgi:hypothetical protein
MRFLETKCQQNGKTGSFSSDCSSRSDNSRGIINEGGVRIEEDGKTTMEDGGTDTTYTKNAKKRETERQESKMHSSRDETDFGTLILINANLAPLRNRD